MTTYSQYNLSSGFTSAKFDGTDSKTWVASNALLSNAVRYNWSGGTGWDIAFNTSGSSNSHVWRDDSNTFPVDFSIDQTTWYSGGSSICPDAETIYLRAANGDVHSFLSPQWQYSSANSSSGPGTLGGAVGTPVWTPSFLDNGNGTMVATVTGSPSSAFGTGFDAVTFTLFEMYAGAEAMLAFVTFPNNTSTEVMNMSSVTYDPSKCYEVRHGSVVLGPKFGTCPRGKRKVHCNFW